MLRKSIEIPPDVAEAFLADMRIFFTKHGHEADEIAARQCRVLREYQRPRDKKLKLTDVKQMFREMRDHS